jgi:hypothetical protein
VIAIRQRVTAVALFYWGVPKRYTGFLTIRGASDGYSNTHFIFHVVHHYQYRLFDFSGFNLSAGTEPRVSSAKQVYSHFTGNL